MKNASQSGVFSLKAPRMRGLFSSPERALEQRLGLLAAVAAEVLVQQVDHRPQVAAFLDVDLEQVAQVVHATARSGPRWRCCSTDAGSVSPCVTMMRRRLARCSPGTSCQAFSPLWSPKWILRFGVAGVEEDAPAVVAHLHVVELRPALRVDADRGAQVDVVVGRALGADVVPPVDEVRLPLLERALQRAVVARG